MSYAGELSIPLCVDVYRVRVEVRHPHVDLAKAGRTMYGDLVALGITIELTPDDVRRAVLGARRPLGRERTTAAISEDDLYVLDLAG